MLRAASVLRLAGRWKSLALSFISGSGGWYVRRQAAVVKSLTFISIPALIPLLIPALSGIFWAGLSANVEEPRRLSASQEFSPPSLGATLGDPKGRGDSDPRV